MAKTIEPKDQLLTIEQAVACTEWSRSWFERYISNLVRRQANGRMKVKDFITGIIEYYKNKDDRGSKPTLHDIKVAKAARELVNPDEVFTENEENISALLAELEAVPSVTRDLVLRKQIEEAIRAAFKRFIARGKNGSDAASVLSKNSRKNQ